MTTYGEYPTALPSTGLRFKPSESFKKMRAQQIDELYDQETITKSIKDWAHEIRLTANIGAHPDKDGLEDVTEEDAKELIDFMEEYLNYVYIMPSKLEAKRAKKEKA